ncbi:signal peptide protein [Rhodopirellula europaea 6C]|uniref:Signal peptide protein n=2 Tax=Rhodopirellula TaxID=265488 RepID=M2AV61_9BACT|nr:signal peptide protein [Rhodopirellula europaea 6C]
MTTEASVEQVIQQYRVLLTRNPTHDEKVDLQPDKGRSVLFHDESEGRLFELLLILVNSETTSTTLIVSRGADEEQTQIK